MVFVIARPAPAFRPLSSLFFFFFNDTATTEIYTLSLHDALPIFSGIVPTVPESRVGLIRPPPARSEEHTSELQSRGHLVCRLLLEKKKERVYRPSPIHNLPATYRHRASSSRR